MQISRERERTHLYVLSTLRTFTSRFVFVAIQTAILKSVVLSFDIVDVYLIERRRPWMYYSGERGATIVDCDNGNYN